MTVVTRFRTIPRYSAKRGMGFVGYRETKYIQLITCRG